jgi:hypothetical protein
MLRSAFYLRLSLLMLLSLKPLFYCCPTQRRARFAHACVAHVARYELVRKHVAVAEVALQLRHD